MTELIVTDYTSAHTRTGCRKQQDHMQYNSDQDAAKTKNGAVIMPENQRSRPLEILYCGVELFNGGIVW